MTAAVHLPEGPAKPDWHDRGLCGPWFKETGFDAWFGPDEDEVAKVTASCKTEEEAQGVRRQMKNDYRMVARKICRECPVQLQCLQFAMDNEMPGLRAGIWGGLTDTQRSHLATRTAKRAAA